MAEELRYTQEHVWVSVEGRTARVGISAFARSELGEIAFVELPAVGRAVRAGEAVAAVDSLKSTSEIVAPLSGTVTELNALLEGEGGLSLLNEDPAGGGWLYVVELSDPRELDSLMSEEQYRRFVAGSCPPGEPESPSR